VSGIGITTVDPEPAYVVLVLPADTNIPKGGMFTVSMTASEARDFALGVLEAANELEPKSSLT